MSHSQPLIPRLDRLRQRLAEQQPKMEDGDLVWAAVAVVLAPDPDAVLLIRRAERAGDPWSGHMALPGGRYQPQDPDLLGTALRETVEEVGIALRSEWLLGQLDDIAPRTPVLPPLAVRPYIFSLPTRPETTLNPEVAHARWIELDRLLQPGIHQPVQLEIRGEIREFPAYRLDDAVVWGMTERILSSLLRHVAQ